MTDLELARHNRNQAFDHWGHFQIIGDTVRSALWRKRYEHWELETMMLENDNEQ